MNISIEGSKAKRQSTIFAVVAGIFYALVGIGLIASSQENGEELK